MECQGKVSVAEYGKHREKMSKLQVSFYSTKESEKSKMKPKLWKVEEGANEWFDEISIEGKNSIS